LCTYLLKKFPVDIIFLACLLQQYVTKDAAIVVKPTLPGTGVIKLHFGAGVFQSPTSPFECKLDFFRRL
jgi:hypothetical protein